MLEKIEITLRGVRPLLMHNGRLADPNDPHTLALSSLVHKPAKTEADLLDIRHLEWLGGSNQYPIDFDALAKGQGLDASAIANAKGVAVGDDPGFRFALRSLKWEIETNRPDLVVKIEGNGIRILRDEECSPYLTGQMKYGVRLIARMHARRSRVDPNNLSAVQRAAFESESRISARVTLAAQQELAKQTRNERLGRLHLRELAESSGD